ncbi:peptidyl-prolyl cis-trans isomerase D [Thioclava dalianensis]|uniref:SurA N-terminal domain-containing protein n=1 Tax=Thioclava dalianensis TaxID=1185766 RepID=UPI00057083E4|nr:SurA N-terminal domain-containing protein [Thioclava dalianensis]SFM73381.1 peptidyl-prolyl cis-trans isomerase D [Thioclava dalianensis]
MKLRSHGKSVVVWILLAMLVLGLGGFGLRSFSGSLQDVGSVGETKISVTEYGRALRQEMQSRSQQLGQTITMAQMKQSGLDQQVMGRLIGQAALGEAARRLGVSMGDTELQKQITNIQAFHNASGNFDRETYKFALRQQGYSEPQFEAQMRDDLARSVLQSAVGGGVEAPQAVTDAYTQYVSQKRGFTWAEITEADLAKPIAKPSDDTLKTYYNDHIQDFTSPETRKITYAWLTPDMLQDKVKIDDATLRQGYQARIDEFKQPEKRLVERLVYPDMKAAQAAKDKFDAGKASFEDLAKERGLSLSDADLGDVTKAELGKAGDAVFALKQPGVVGPVETDLGPALFSMNGIIAPQETSFADAREELAGEAESDMARRDISKQSESLQDKLAGGATLEDLAKETDMELGQIDFTADSSDGIAGYDEFRKAAQDVTTDDFPQLENLPDGGVFALRLDKIEPPAPIPFEQVRAKVLAAWHQSEAVKAEEARAKEVVAAVEGGKSLGSTGLLTTTVPSISRGGHSDELSPPVIAKVFATAPGKAAQVTADGKVYVIVTDKVIDAKADDPDVKLISGQISQQLSQSLANDVLNFYATAVEDEAGLSIDSQAVTAVQSQM